MKALCLILCLLNAGLLLWEWRGGAFESPVGESGLASILLAEERIAARRGAMISAAMDAKVPEWERSGYAAIWDELNAKTQPVRYVVKSVTPLEVPKPTKPVEAAKPLPADIIKPAPPPQTCYEIGPFADDGALKHWLAGKLAVKTETVYKEVAVPGDYQVYFPAAKNPEQSRINKMMLNAKGITDIWTVPAGDNKGALSLGVFADRERAESFKSQLARQGVQAEVKQRSKFQRQVFAKAMLDKSQRQQLSGHSVTLSPCQ